MKNEAKKIQAETLPSPQKLLQQELWSKAIVNVSTMSNLSAEESNIAKLLADYKKKSSIPQKSAKLKVILYLILGLAAAHKVFSYQGDWMCIIFSMYWCNKNSENHSKFPVKPII